MISSTKNQYVKSASRLHRARVRRETGQMLVEGPKVLASALDAGFQPNLVFTTETGELDRYAPGTTVFEVTAHVLKAIGDTSTPQSPIAVMDIPHAPDSIPDTDMVVLVGVADPGNVGTIIRTAAGLGWSVGLSGNTADVWSPKVVRAGAGAHFTTWVGSVVIGDLSDTHRVVATTVSGGKASLDETGPFALLIGSEAQGLPENMVGAAHHELTIPMAQNTESLNAAVAAALGMWILHAPFDQE